MGERVCRRAKEYEKSIFWIKHCTAHRLHAFDTFGRFDSTQHICGSLKIPAKWTGIWPMDLIGVRLERTQWANISTVRNVKRKNRNLFSHNSIEMKCFAPFANRRVDRGKLIRRSKGEGSRWRRARWANRFVYDAMADERPWRVALRCWGWPFTVYAWPVWPMTGISLLSICTFADVFHAPRVSLSSRSMRLPQDSLFNTHAKPQNK